LVRPDFGTGYSSLGYLRAFPFDKIKIDRSFVREILDRTDCVAIVRVISGLGRSLGIATTAERRGDRRAARAAAHRRLYGGTGLSVQRGAARGGAKRAVGAFWRAGIAGGLTLSAPPRYPRTALWWPRRPAQ
jgi:predicted signal transduction protein with EAL and GGDEF domain